MVDNMVKIERILNNTKKGSILKINGIPKYKKYPDGRFLWISIESQPKLFYTDELLTNHKNDKLTLVTKKRRIN